MDIERHLGRPIIDLLPHGKIILISGPRQVGKTYLSLKLFQGRDCVYLNYDDPDDREVIARRSWPRNVDAVIFDELHKMPGWKTWIKALYDKGSQPALVVTGSARMDTFRKGGDSLAGRHFHFRLNPLMLTEVMGIGSWSERESLDRLLQFGGFPEPFTSGDKKYLKLWHKSHIDCIIKEDILDLEKVRELKKIELLIGLLAKNVGSRVSYASLAKSLEVSPHTIKHWLQILEDLYVVFKVLPLTHKFSASLLKSPKFYFFDTSRVRGDEGARLENLVATQLWAYSQLLQDSCGERVSVHFLANKQKREVDFALLKDDQVDSLLEVKYRDNKPSGSLKYFTRLLQPRMSVQAVYHLDREQHFNGIDVMAVEKALKKIT